VVKHLGRIAQSLLRSRAWVSGVVQGILILLSLLVAWLLRFEFTVPQVRLLVSAGVLLLAVRVLFIAQFKLLHGWWSYAGVHDVADLLKATSCGSIAFIVLLRFVFGQTSFPVSVYLLEFIITSGVLCIVRFISRIVAEAITKSRTVHGVMLVGAGFAAQMIARELRNSGNLQLVGCVDDDHSKIGAKIVGVPVLGSVDQLPALVKKHSIAEVLIAIPSATNRQMRRFVDICERAGVPFRTVPALHDFIHGVETTNQLREVSMEDLLGREPVSINVSAVRDRIARNGVMVTGAAGSIGSELCRQILSYSPAELICVDQNENGMFFLEQELSRHPNAHRMTYIVADVGNGDRMQQIMAEHKIKIIFHAAAYKHVPVMEQNVTAAIYNNVFSLLTLLRTAESAGCSDFVMISSDKAVNPTSVMGCTKRVGEIILSSRPSTMRCLSVRFGNVLGSNGSVIPIFREQLRRGKPLTVTHPEITRYFMTINEAVSLVLQAAVIGNSRDILVLDMGDPIKIVEVARTMIRLSGKSPVDVEIRFTGLRKGEKLYEELFYDEEKVVAAPHPKIRKTVGPIQSWRAVQLSMDELRVAASYSDELRIREILANLVPQFTYPKQVVVHERIPTLTTNAGYSA
jgi:FlaA1/EpsC-like NDP-sugar epimerase